MGDTTLHDLTERVLVLGEISARADALRDLRRDFHAHPELCYEERRTSDVIATTLAASGIAVHRDIAKTGLVGVISNGTSGRAIGIRADMDALPIFEQNKFAHASRMPGKMHACGHDGHMAMLLGAADYLARHGNFDGTVYLIFQPAEEGGGGAREMIRDGLFERFPMDAIFGMHNYPGLATGNFAVTPGPVTASSNRFKVVIHGRGGHAALPHQCVDPLLPACQMVQAFQTIISRNKRADQPALISATMIHGGDAVNVIPDCCEVDGTVRTFDLATLDLIEARMRVIAEATARAFDAECEFSFERKYPATVNDPAHAAFVRDILVRYAGEDRVVELEPSMGSEDFSFYLQEKPGCFFMIGNGDGDHRDPGAGAGPCLAHNPSYDFNDAVTPIGASIWVRLVESWFAEGGLGPARGF